MKINVKRIRRTALLLGLLMMLSVVFSACPDLESVPEVNREDVLGDKSIDINESSEEELITPEGATDAPVVTDIVNISPYTVALSGTCEPGATIRVTGGENDVVETVANGEYFIVEVDLDQTYKVAPLKVTAQVEGENESLERTVIAYFNATADTLLNGNSVSVGGASRLYFDRMLSDAKGENLYTLSQLSDIENYVNDTVSSYYNDRAKAQEVELIYVLVPNVTTIYPEILPEYEKPYTTVYDQVLSTLNNTQATVIDMRAIFQGLRDDKNVIDNYGGLYRVTDSALTDYGAYLTYSEILKVVANNFPNCAPRALTDFEWNKVNALGGNLVSYRDLNGSIINEDIVVATPKFSLALGSNGSGSSSISSLRKFVDSENGDYRYFTTVNGDDGVNGVAERWLIDTARAEENLPNVILYRDYSALAFADLLAERFDKTLLVASGEHTINLSAAGQYAAAGKNAVDYIIVVLSEENMDTAFNSVVTK